MANEEQITIKELEDMIFDLEEIVVTIRAPSHEKVQKYPYERKAAGNTTVSDWLEQRLKPIVGEREIVITNGDYSKPHGKTKLSTLRDGYSK